MNLKNAVIHRKGAKGAKDAKKTKDLPEASEGFVIHFLGEWAKIDKLLFPLRSLYLRAFAVRILGLSVASRESGEAHPSPFPPSLHGLAYRSRQLFGTGLDQRGVLAFNHDPEQRFGSRGAQQDAALAHQTVFNRLP